MRLLRTLICATFLSILAVALVGGSVGMALVKREAATLPGLQAVQERRPAAVSRILASDGSLLGEFAAENRTPVPLSQIPLLVQSAFISAEDRNFWHHSGVDPFAIARAALTNLRMRGSGRRPIGASTITQQVVKNLITGDERSLRRKVREALLAMRMEKQLGKQSILEAYLNEIYLGQGAYGVAAASQAYYSKPLASLDLAEVALLAGMPKGPTGFDPVRRADAARARRAYVLQRMQDDGVITAAQAAQALSEPLPHPAARSLGGTADSYFGEEARREVVATLGADALYRGGLTVRTSMDVQLQPLAERTLRDGLSDYDRRHGWRGPVSRLPRGVQLGDARSWQPALLALEPPAGAEDWRMAAVLGFARDGSASVGFEDGTVGSLGFDAVRWARAETARGLGPPPRRVADVLAAGDVVLTSVGADGRLELRQIPEVQGSLIAMDVRTGQVLAVAGGFSHDMGSFDRATQSVRQPGSTFKPFVYLTAFENGYDPTSPVLDSPVAIDPGGGAPVWRPGADGGNGWGLITARRALENSRNQATVRMLYDLGLDAVGKTARDFGLYPSLPSYAAALGALEVSDLKMTAAYAMFANGGHRIVPTFIDEVDGADGKPLAVRAVSPMDESTRIADPVAIAQLTSVLEGVVRHGTAAGPLSKLALPIAGKTGTTNDNVDAWFVGFTPDIAVGVHVGFDRPAPLGAEEFGGRASAPVFGAFVKAALAIHPPSASAFSVPPGAHIAKVDPLSGEPSKSGSEEVIRDVPAHGN